MPIKPIGIEGVCSYWIRAYLFNWKVRLRITLIGFFADGSLIEEVWRLPLGFSNSGFGFTVA